MCRGPRASGRRVENRHVELPRVSGAPTGLWHPPDILAGAIFSPEREPLAVIEEHLVDRFRLFHLVSSLEVDLRSILRAWVLPFTEERDVYGGLYGKASGAAPSRRPI